MIVLATRPKHRNIYLHIWLFRMCTYLCIAIYAAAAAFTATIANIYRHLARRTDVGCQPAASGLWTLDSI